MIQNAAGKPRGPLGLLGSYLFWTYERGSFHYDILVTLILLFLFIAPHVIDFHARPIPEVPQRSQEVLVRNAGEDGHRFVYKVRSDDLHGASSPADIQDRLSQIVHTIAGDAQLENIKPVTDPHGRVIAYDVTIRR